jgi:SAM-dependent methyltransferase
MRLFADDTDATWRHFGALDPYYGVVSHDEFRMARLDKASREKFFDFGRSEISTLFKWLGANGFNVERNSALDFGCGVGRLVIPLAERFNNVYGVDISPHMIAEGFKNVERFGHRNVHLSGEIPGNVSFDFIHSLYVLQHVDAGRGTEIIYKLWNCLGRGGTLCLQVPTVFRGSKKGKVFRQLRKAIPATQVFLNIARGSRWNEPGMQMNVYDINAISFGLFERGAERVSLHRYDSHRINFGGAYIIAVRS